MCGIAGKVSLWQAGPVEESVLRRMLGAIRHRGPDQFGMYFDQGVGLGNARLSIIDLSSGQQPIGNEDGTVWIVFNGEVFNYRELRKELDRRGHCFSTETDTEVILHLYEDLGPACLRRLNGQFAIAIWDARKRELFLGRDRLGVRPVFYTQAGGALLFASEIKAIFATGEVRAELDPVALDQIFTYWSTLSPRTAFHGIRELPPGHYLLASEGQVSLHQYWELSFPEEDQRNGARSLQDYLDEFRALLIDATTLRLRADVPVGAYLSGGLDSSTLAAIIRRYGQGKLDTFSIAFTDERFDESEHQERMACFLGTEHQVVRATHADIGRVFPQVVWHAETPLLRTSPAPMFLLSQCVRDRNYKVVVTGEGADEFLGGYDIFKEEKIRRFWACQPRSTWRPRLFQRLYADIPDLSQNPTFLPAFFGGDLDRVNDPGYSHAIRWKNTRRTHRFFSDDLARAIATSPGADHSVYYPERFMSWGPLQRAQFLESSIFLSQYLLSSQGDRMGMAHSVEGRYPFLDYRVVEFCSRLPARMKLRCLTEKYLLKQLGRELLPSEIWTRVKRPYRAPIQRSFFSAGSGDYVRELLSPAQVQITGHFKPGAVNALVKKLEQGQSVGETDEMALAGILSTQLVERQFVQCFQSAPPLSHDDNVKVCQQFR